jgi:hypothetical protein
LGGGGCDGEAAKKAAAGWKERRGRQHGVATGGGYEVAVKGGGGEGRR